MRPLPLVLSAVMGNGPAAFAETAQPIGDPTAPEESAQLEAANLTIAGLDANNAQLGDALTDALRASAERRGISLAAKLALSELRLAGGCADNAEACLAKGAKLIGGDRLVFGKLVVRASGDATVNIAILDVASAAVHTQTSVPLRAEALGADTIDATADRLLSELIPREVEVVAPTPADEDVRPSPEPSTSATTPDAESSLVWGNYAPRPRWKWVWFGTSLGTAVLSAAGAITTAVLARKSDDDVLESALNSGQNGNPEISDQAIAAGTRAICDEAGSHPDGGDRVYNSDVATRCRDGGRFVRASNVFMGIGVVAGLSTAASVIVLFVHRKGGRRAFLSPEISPRSAGLSLRGKF